MTSCSLTFSVSSHISHSNPTSFQQQQLAHPPPLTAPRPQSGSRHRPRRRSRQRMQDLAFLGPMERSQPGPSKYNGGHLPPVPYIHRAEEVLVGLATARAQSDKAYAFAIVDGYIRSKKARGQVPSYIASKIELLEARVSQAPLSFTVHQSSVSGSRMAVEAMCCLERALTADTDELCECLHRRTRMAPPPSVTHHPAAADAVRRWSEPDKQCGTRNSTTAARKRHRGYGGWSRRPEYARRHAERDADGGNGSPSARQQTARATADARGRSAAAAILCRGSRARGDTCAAGIPCRGSGAAR